MYKRNTLISHSVVFTYRNYKHLFFLDFYGDTILTKGFLLFNILLFYGISRYIQNIWALLKLRFQLRYFPKIFTVKKWLFCRVHSLLQPFHLNKRQHRRNDTNSRQNSEQACQTMSWILHTKLIAMWQESLLEKWSRRRLLAHLQYVCPITTKFTNTKIHISYYRVNRKRFKYRVLYYG